MKYAINFDEYNIDKLEYKRYLEESIKEFENEYKNGIPFNVYESFGIKDQNRLNELIDEYFKSSFSSFQIINNYYLEYAQKGSFNRKNKKDNEISEHNLKIIASIHFQLRVLLNKIVLYKEKFIDLFTKVLAQREVIFNKLKNEDSLSENLKKSFLERFDNSLIIFEMNIDKLIILQRTINSRIDGLDVLSKKVDIDSQMKEIKKSISKVLKSNSIVRIKNSNKLLASSTVPLLTGDIEEKNKDNSIFISEKSQKTYLYYYLEEITDFMNACKVLCTMGFVEGNIQNEEIFNIVDGERFDKIYRYLSQNKPCIAPFIIEQMGEKHFSSEKITELYTNFVDDVIKLMFKVGDEAQNVFDHKIYAIKALFLLLEDPKTIPTNNSLFYDIKDHYQFLNYKAKELYRFFISDDEYKNLSLKLEKVYNEYCCMKIEHFSNAGRSRGINYFPYDEEELIDISSHYNGLAVYQLDFVEKLTVSFPKAIVEVYKDIIIPYNYASEIDEFVPRRIHFSDVPFENQKINPKDYKSKITTIIFPNVKAIYNYPFDKYLRLEKVIAPRLETICGQFFKNIKFNSRSINVPYVKEKK